MRSMPKHKNSYASQGKIGSWPMCSDGSDRQWNCLTGPTAMRKQQLCFFFFVFLGFFWWPYRTGVNLGVAKAMGINRSGDRVQYPWEDAHGSAACQRFRQNQRKDELDTVWIKLFCTLMGWRAKCPDRAQIKNPMRCQLQLMVHLVKKDHSCN